MCSYSRHTAICTQVIQRSNKCCFQGCVSFVRPGPAWVLLNQVMQKNKMHHNKQTNPKFSPLVERIHKHGSELNLVKRVGGGKIGGAVSQLGGITTFPACLKGEKRSRMNLLQYITGPGNDIGSSVFTITFHVQIWT